MTTPAINTYPETLEHSDHEHLDQMSLERVSALGSVDGLLLTMTVSQSYRNRTSNTLETVYTFPVAFGAVLLGVTAQIGGRKLHGSVYEAQDAQHKYESAISSGDAPILLEKSSDDLYTANLGNLKPGEDVVIEVRYAQLLHRAADRVQLRFPTTIAPRYGSPAAAGLRAHESVTASHEASYPFDMQIKVKGALANSAASSASHRISVMRDPEGIVVRLTKQAFLDRDFVLDLVQPAEAPLPCEALLAPSGNGTVALASFCPPITRPARNALDLKILVDCSGSMAGDSIAQARRAIHKVLSELTTEDHFSLSRFGDHAEHEFTRMASANEQGLARAAKVLEVTEADMGGTELNSALAETFTIRDFRGQADVLLITDGEVWETWMTVGRAALTKHRVFAIGVGSAPAESLLQQLARATGGACEMVGPNEDIEAAVMRMLARIRTESTKKPQIQWSRKPAWVTELPASLFFGDTIHVFAGFDEPLTELDVKLSCPFESDEVSDPTTRSGSGGIELSVRAKANDSESKPDALKDLPRMAAWTRISDAKPRIESRASTKAWALDLALQNQLVTRETSLFLVHERADAEKTDGMPALQQITHMLAAGWSGVGSVVQDFQQSFSRSSVASYKVFDEDESYYDVPDPYDVDPDDMVIVDFTVEDILDELERMSDCIDEASDIDRFGARLKSEKIPRPVFAMIDELQRLGLTQRQAMALFLQVLIHRYAYEGIPGNLVKQIISDVVQTIPKALEPRAVELIDPVLQNTTLNAW